MDAKSIKTRQMLVTGGIISGLIALVILGLWWSDPNRKVDADLANADAEVVSKNYTTPTAILDPSEVWITRSQAELEAMKKQNEDLSRKLAELTELVKGPVRDDFNGMPTGLAMDYDPKEDADTDEQEKKEASAEPAGGTFSTSSLGELPPASSSKIPTALPAPPPAVVATPLPATIPPPIPASKATGTGVGVEEKKPGILSVDLGGNTSSAEGDNQESPAGEEPSSHNINGYLPSGSFVKAALLSGLDAPTGGQAQSNPQPVLLRLVNDGTLPNRFSSRIQSCHMTAAGYGDIASERAYLRLERMSCVLKDGQVVDSNVKGYVSGEDGKAGLRGLVVSKQGQMIAKSLISGVAGGIGSGISSAYSSISTSATTGTVTTVDPGKIGEFGVANGFGKTLEKVADWYLQRANETYPIIEIASGRTVDVVLTDGFSFGKVNILKDAANNDGGES